MLPTYLTTGWPKKRIPLLENSGKTYVLAKQLTYIWIPNEKYDSFGSIQTSARLLVLVSKFETWTVKTKFWSWSWQKYWFSLKFCFKTCLGLRLIWRWVSREILLLVLRGKKSRQIQYQTSFLCLIAVCLFSAFDMKSLSLSLSLSRNVTQDSRANCN